MPRVFFKGIALKWIDLVTDEDRDGHGSLRRPKSAFYCTGEMARFGDGRTVVARRAAAAPYFREL
jgi:hypothetical protein